MDNLQKDLKAKTLGYLSAALGLVAGLAWNEAITSLINHLFPLSKNTVTVKFLYAVVLTAVVVILLRYIDRFLKAE